jgi:hypothetical protein
MEASIDIVCENFGGLFEWTTKCTLIETMSLKALGGLKEMYLLGVEKRRIRRETLVSGMFQANPNTAAGS